MDNKYRRKRREVEGTDDGDAPQGSGWRYLFWISLIALIWYYLGYGINSNQVKLTYSEFRVQIQQNNIEKVTFSDHQVTGSFNKPYIVQSGKDKESYKFFSTTIPPVEDPTLLRTMEAKGIVVTAESKNSSWLLYLLISFLPLILFFGYLIYASQKMQDQMKGSFGDRGIFGFGKSGARRYNKTDSEVHFSDVAGLENAKKELIEIVDYLKDPKKFSKLGAEIPKGILLVGPPGCGKTLLAKAVAGEIGIPFFSISGSEFVEVFVGVGASRVRDMFDNAKKDSPSIIFIDEIDSIGRVRGSGIGGGHDEREQTLNQILSEMDGFAPHEAVVVVAATNRPDVLDPALTRPGRFDRQVVLDLPQKEAREKILKIHTKNVPLADDVNLENIAARTVGFSGAFLKNLVNEAALWAGRNNKKKVEAQDFDYAIDKILLGLENEERIQDREKKLTAYHESGHALAAKLLPEADPLQKVTIIPHGQALGATEQTPDTDRHNFSRAYLYAVIAVQLGGRAAEKLVFNDLTSGSANDLRQATQLARKMVCQWGMSDKLGASTFRQGEEHVFLGREMTQPKDFSEYTAEIIDKEIKGILDDMEIRVFNLLKENRDKLDSIANALIERETLDNKDVDEILNRLG